MNEFIKCSEIQNKGFGYFSNLPIKKNTLILKEHILVSINKHSKSKKLIEFYLIYNILKNKNLEDKFMNFAPLEIDSNCKSKESMHELLQNINVQKLKCFFSFLEIDTIILLYEKIKRNCFESENKIFVAFDGTKFNHACDANVEYYFENGNLLFYACKDIKENEELTIQYVDHKYSYLLYPTYGFNCDCSLCSKIS